MAIGIGGGSVLSRALGAKPEKAKVTFANQIMMTFFFGVTFCAIGHFFSADMLLLFWCKGPHNKTG
jgi:Na+-driven multidrug efflux pump